MERTDDSFVLDEAALLAFLADVDQPVEPTSTLPPPAAIDIVAPTNPVPCTNKSWRQRRKEEILTLREQAKQLEDELSKLRGLRLLCSDSVLSSTVNTSTSKQWLVWELLAKQHFSLRCTSERENERLRKSLKLHVVRAKYMRRAFGRLLREHGVMDLMKQLPSTDEMGPPVDSSGVFCGLLEGMDNLFDSHDALFQQIKMDEVPCPGQRNESVKRRAEGVFVELLDCHVLPFDLCRSVDAIWALKSSEAKDLNMVFIECAVTGRDTLMKRIRVRAVVDGVEIQVVVHLVVRRYEERGKAIFITRLHVEPLGNLFAPTFKATMQTELIPGEASSTGPTTVMRTHCLVTDHAGPGGNQSGWKSSALYNKGLKTWEDSVVSFNYRVEDELLRKTVRASN